MERVYIYGLCWQVVLHQTLWGIDKSPVAILSFEKIGAIVSYWGNSSPGAIPENLLAHNNILETVADITTVLPVRFGTLLSAKALDEFIKENTDKIMERLTLVQGKVEMGLKVLKQGSACRGLKMSPAEDSPSGMVYMQRLFARRQKEMLAVGAEEESLQEVRLQLQKTADHHKKSKPREPFLFNETFLMSKEQAQEFYKTVNEMKEKYPHLLFLASGPWPPYAFACWEDG